MHCTVDCKPNRKLNLLLLFYHCCHLQWWK